MPSVKKCPVMQLRLVSHTLSPVTMMVSLSEPMRVLKCPVMHVSNVDLPVIGRRNSFRKWYIVLLLRLSLRAEPDFTTMGRYHCYSYALCVAATSPDSSVTHLHVRDFRRF